MNTIDMLMSQWRLWQESQSLSETTVVERERVTRHMLTYTDEQPLSVTPAAIIAFCARPEITAASRASYHASIRAYCAWLVSADLRADDPSAKTPRPKRPKGQPRPIHNAQLTALLARANRRRTRMMILLAALAGLRVHEIAKFHGDDIDVINGILTVTGKGGKTAMIPAHPAIIEEASKFPRHEYWFPNYIPNRHGVHAHIVAASVSQSIGETMVRAGIRGKPHQLRHWYGTTLLDAGVDLRIVQELMRHESPATTAIYTKVDMRRQVEGIALQVGS